MKHPMNRKAANPATLNNRNVCKQRIFSWNSAVSDAQEELTIYSLTLALPPLVVILDPAAVDKIAATRAPLLRVQAKTTLVRIVL